MTYQNLILQQEDHVAILTINHPPVNTWNLATMKEFGQALEQVEGDDSIRVLILTGGGEKAFSAGFDVTDAANASVTSPMGRDLWERLDRFTKPVIAAVNGFALGGGLELALSCHFRLMVDDPKAMVGLTELNLGILPGWGGTQRLSRLVGRSKALDMILFSRRLSPQEALAAGLVDRLVAREVLLDEARAMAKELSLRPPIAVRWVLKAMTAGLYDGPSEGLKVEAEGSARVRDSEDRQEGFAAFLERRPPKFQGK